MEMTVKFRFQTHLQSRPDHDLNGARRNCRDCCVRRTLPDMTGLRRPDQGYK